MDNSNILLYSSDELQFFLATSENQELKMVKVSDSQNRVCVEKSLSQDYTSSRLLGNAVRSNPRRQVTPQWATLQLTSKRCTMRQGKGCIHQDSGDCNPRNERFYFPVSVVLGSLLYSHAVQIAVHNHTHCGQTMPYLYRNVYCASTGIMM